jgi:hypothetical protein
MIRRIAAALCLGVLAACSGHASNAAAVSTATPAPPLFYPPGIVPPGDWSGQTRDGIYSADTLDQCCFLAGHTTLTLDHPPGAQLAVFKFFVPSVTPFLKSGERVRVAFDGIPSGKPADIPAGLHDVIFTIPPSLRHKGRLTATLDMSVHWIPQEIGLNADRRELSIMLLRVGYI